MRVARSFLVLLLALATACTDARSPADAPALASSSAGAAASSSEPACATGGPESLMFVRLYGRRWRHDYTLRGPLEDIRRACPAVVAGERSRDRHLAIGRACDLEPLEPSGQWWLEVTGDQLTRALVNDAADELLGKCPPPAYELKATLLFGPYVDEAACLADDEKATFREDAPMMEERLAYVEKQLANAEERLAKECPASGPKLCEKLEHRVRGLKQQRNAARNGVRSAFRAVCAIH